MFFQFEFLQRIAPFLGQNPALSVSWSFGPKPFRVAIELN
jgi:hypothetical protein